MNPPQKSTYHRQARMKNPEAPLTGNTFSQKGHLIVKWRNITQQANVNISISLSVYLQQTNARGPIFLLVVKQRRTVKRCLFKKKKRFQMVPSYNWVSAGFLH